VDSARLGGWKLGVWIVAGACLASASCTIAQTPTNQTPLTADTRRETAIPCATAPRPQLHPPFTRWMEDWSFLRDRSKYYCRDRWDKIKYIALGTNPERYLSIGGQARGWYEAYQNQYWGSGPQDNNGWLNQDYLIHGDLHFTKTVRLFTEFQSALERGRTGGPRPYDRDALDLHQAFFDVPLTSQGNLLTLRIGRQELEYGSGRLVTARYGLNSRISWDGFKVTAEPGKNHIEAFATRPTLNNAGIFDDVPDSKTMFWGLYATHTFSPKLLADAYYFGWDTKSWTFASGTAHFQPQTLGSRVAGTAGHLDFNNEANIQVGHFGNRNVLAWSASLLHGYTFASTKLSPRLALRADVTSGDRGNPNHALGSFYPLYASGKYFEEADLNGPVNTVDLIPSVDLHASKSVTITPIYGAFWRESTADGLYGYIGQLYRPGNESAARFIGQLGEVDVNYLATSHTTIRGVYEHFAVGEFLRQSPPGKSVNYGTVWVVYHF
jgi:hypothetical protein